MQNEIERRKQRWIDFSDLSSAVNRLLVIDCTEHIPKRPPLWWETMREREEWAYRQYMQKMENMSVIPDNTIPHLSMITGTEIFAEAFGCDVYKPEDNNPFHFLRYFTGKMLFP